MSKKTYETTINILFTIEIDDSDFDEETTEQAKEDAFKEEAGYEVERLVRKIGVISGIEDLEIQDGPEELL